MEICDSIELQLVEAFQLFKTGDDRSSVGYFLKESDVITSAAVLELQGYRADYVKIKCLLTPEGDLYEANKLVMGLPLDKGKVLDSILEKLSKHQKELIWQNLKR